MRKYIVKYPSDIDGAIILGTSGQIKSVKPGIGFVNFLAKLRGEHHRSKLVQAIAFGSYNSRYKSEKSIYSWLTDDPELLAKFNEGPVRNFTLNGYRAMFEMLLEINGEEWAHTVPTGLPLCIMAGDGDPVGEYGEGVQRVADALQDAEVYDLTYRMYPGARHELCAWSKRKEFFADLLDWIMKTREGVLEDRGVLL